MFKIYFRESFKIFLVTYCHLKKAGYYRMRVKNILFTFDMNHLMVATRLPLRFANQLHIMSLLSFNSSGIDHIFCGLVCAHNFRFARLTN
jgi:hypothetical protein